MKDENNVVLCVFETAHSDRWLVTCLGQYIHTLSDLNFDIFFYIYLRQKKGEVSNRKFMLIGSRSTNGSVYNGVTLRRKIEVQ
jgi:hypothetical protein